MSRTRGFTLGLALGATLIIMLVAGLNPRGYNFSNDVSLGQGAPGLLFPGQGVAYSEALPFARDRAEATLLLALRPAAAAESRGFQAIAALDSGDSKTQLMVAQWQRQLFVMTGDDYAYRNKGPRLVAPPQKGDSNTRLFAIVLNAEAAALYEDAERVAFRQGIALPDDGRPMRLVLGNAVDGTLPWSGTLFGLALYQRALTVADLTELTSRWRKTERFAAFPRDDAALLYDFTAANDSASEALVPRQPPLRIPTHRAFVEPTFPVWNTRSASLPDMLLNFVGFVPFGVLFVMVLVRRNDQRSALRSVVLVAAGGLLISGGIELTQAFMPTRKSSLLDLSLNGAGAAAGAALGIAIAEVQRFRRRGN